jgi:hypothetical protein
MAARRPTPKRHVLVDLFAYYTMAEFHGILVQGGASTSTSYGPSGLTKDKLLKNKRDKVLDDNFDDVLHLPAITVMVYGDGAADAAAMSGSNL